MKVSIGRAAKELGVSRDTLRRWEAAGRIGVERASNGRRRYDLEEVRNLVPVSKASKGITIAYARVKSEIQEWELARQVSLLESFCSVNDWVFQVLYDKGGQEYGTLQGLGDVLRRVRDGEVARLVVTHIDRIPKPVSPLVFLMCEYFGTELVIINATDNKLAQEEGDIDVSGLVSEFARDWTVERNRKLEPVK